MGREVVGARVVREDPHQRVLLAQGPQEVLEEGGGLWVNGKIRRKFNGFFQCKINCYILYLLKQYSMENASVGSDKEICTIVYLLLSCYVGSIIEFFRTVERVNTQRKMHRRKTTNQSLKWKLKVKSMVPFPAWKWLRAGILRVELGTESCESSRADKKMRVWVEFLSFLSINFFPWNKKVVFEFWYTHFNLSEMPFLKNIFPIS